MADNSGHGGGVGGARVPGQRNERTAADVRKCEEFIKKTWNVQSVPDAFPNSIRPVRLGSSALQILKQIATKISLPDGQALFLSASKTADGSPISAGYTHCAAVLATIKATEASASNATSAPKVKTEENVKNPKLASPKSTSTSKKTINSSTPHSTGKACQAIGSTVPLSAKSPQAASNTAPPSSIDKGQRSVSSTTYLSTTAKAPQAVSGTAAASNGEAQRAPEAVMHNQDTQLDHNRQEDYRHNSKVTLEEVSVASTIPSHIRKRSLTDVIIAPNVKKAKKDLDLKKPPILVKEHPTNFEQKPTSKQPQPKPAAQRPRLAKDPTGKTDTIQPADSKVIPDTIIDIEEELDQKIEEHKRANAAFFAGSAARQAVFDKDTIRVSGSSTQLQDILKKHCTELHETFGAVRPSQEFLYKMARPHQAHLVLQVVRLLDRGLHALKVEMEAIFAETATPA